MKKSIKKWLFRISFTLVFMFSLLVGIVLMPTVLYARETTHGNLRIYHQSDLDPSALARMDEAMRLTRSSEFYQPGFRLDICLNDGSQYPVVMRKLRGPAFGWGFYNKVVLMGEANYRENYVELNGYRWNLAQLIAHEAIHCYQFKKLGFWHSKPAASIADWKWEGYAEYVSRRAGDQLDMCNNISRLLATEKTNNNNWISFADGTGTVIPYYRSWLLVQYCMDIKKLSYQQVLSLETEENILFKEMLIWFQDPTKPAGK